MKVLITGASGLLGRAINNALTDYHKIIATDVVDDYEKLDVTNEKDVENFFNKNKFEAVIHCAYPHLENWGDRFENVSYQDFCSNVALQLGGAFNIIKHSCIKFEKSSGGSIVMLGSVSGSMSPRFDTYEGLPMTTPVAYSCIKSALISLIKYSVKYYANKNIRINSVSPSGIIDNHNPLFLERYRKYCLNKGMLDAADIVGAVKFLISDDSKYINGQNLIVDDGFTL
jgi:NAD(P)-dependent dehydrogenase (short-subunit alcohol dehydrogenase family)